MGEKTMAIQKLSLLLLPFLGAVSCMFSPSPPDTHSMESTISNHETIEQKLGAKMPEGSESILIAGGCFWCIEALFDDLKGVYWAESGYAGGDDPDPTYEKVCSGIGGHAEAVKIVFDPQQVSAEDLLRYFFALHDPTTLNRQGPDSGSQYRSAIFYSNETEKARAEKIRKEISDAKLWNGPIVTTIEPVRVYKRAEDYHQDYFVKYEKASPAERMKMNSGYCAAIIEPKVRKFREKFAAKLKKP